MILGAVTVLAMWDLTVDDGGLLAGDGAQWEWGLAEKGPSTVGWATRLDRPYLNDSIDTLELALPNLTATTRPRLFLRHTYSFAAGDAGHLEVKAENGWQAIAPAYASEVTFRGDSGGWIESVWVLDDLVHGSRARLVFVADTTGADDGWFVSDVSVVDGDAVPPRLSPVVVPVDNQDIHAAPRVQVAAEDDLLLVGVDVVYTLDDGAEVTTAMVDQRDGTFAVDLPVVAPGTDVRWHAVARDAENSARWPTDDEAQFRVYLAAPEALTGPSGRVIGEEATLSWSAPDSPWPVLGYEVFAVGGEVPVASAPGLAAAVPLETDGPVGFEVRAVYADGLGDASEPVWLDAEVPRLTRIEPAVLRAGETRRIVVVGESLYLSAADVDVDLGDGVEVFELTVVDVARVDAVVFVAADAAPGPRAVSIAGAWGTSTHEDAVRIEGVALSSLAAAPSALEQGWSGTVSVTAPEDFDGPLRRADEDAAFVASAVGVTTDREATLSIAVSRVASPGVHRLWFDDGSRWWSVDLVVTERVETRASCDLGASSWSWAWMVAFALRRRRPRH